MLPDLFSSFVAYYQSDDAKRLEDYQADDAQNQDRRRLWMVQSVRRDRISILRGETILRVCGLPAARIGVVAPLRVGLEPVVFWIELVGHFKCPFNR